MDAVLLQRATGASVSSRNFVNFNDLSVCVGTLFEMNKIRGIVKESFGILAKLPALLPKVKRLFATLGQICQPIRVHFRHRTQQ